MFERYTDRARRVIFFARYDASALASSSIDTEHLLLGLLREGAGIAGKTFKRNKLTYELVRREIEARGRLQTPTSTSVDMPLSPEAKLVLQHASEEAQRMDASHIDTEHLLLGLLRESECLAADILTSKGVREETRLQSPAKEVAPRPKEAFPNAAKLTLIDSHCHIDMPAFDQDRAAVVARAREAGIEDILIAGGVDAEAGHRRALRVAEEFRLPVSAGVHPHEAKLATEAIYDELRGFARDKRIVAIGEIGLDFHYDYSPRDVQREVFRRQVRLARDVGLPLIIHTREADDETAAILEEEGARETGGVIHCFTGGEDLARRALALGFYVSFSGIIAFPRSETIQTVARTVPEDRLLVETDAPFLAPPPHRGQRNEPAFVIEVARKVAYLRGESVEAVGAAAKRNFERLFRRA